MEKITNGHPLSQTPDFVKENVETLKALFPTIVKEGKIDIEELQALLGNEVETGDEYYRFTWAGKSLARKEANKPSTATLRPNKPESKDWDTTQNIFIEGDNLEALKLLQKSYANKIKMIYIDPPYNTGKDFVYRDNYADNLSNYLAITGQLDEEGKRNSTNAESDGRYHSNWLNMMYPRLKLARNLLTADGAIFISIDDNEQSNLRQICNEIFGEENLIAQIIWEKKYSPQNDAKYFSDSHEFIIVYVKNKELFEIGMLPRTDEANLRYKNPDNDPRGVWKSSDLTRQEYRPNDDYEIISPKTGKRFPPPKGCSWGRPQDKVEELIADNRIWFGSDGNSVPSLKRFLSEVKQGITPQTIWFREDVGDTQEGKKIIKDVFGNVSIFETPKPPRLIQRCMLTANLSNSDIVLDFFAGSGTTADAVMQLNAENGSSRKFICVQLPEPTDKESEPFKAGYKTIAEITKERIRKAGKAIVDGKLSMLNELKKKADGKMALGDDQTEIDNLQSAINRLDTGFKAFKLDSSNIKAWDGNPDNLNDNLFNAENNIKADRTEEDVLYEILLKYGLDLAQPIEQKAIAGKTVFNIGLGALFICLADGVTTDVAEGIGKWKKELEPATCKVIFKDTGFTDVEKTNSMQILKRYGIDEVNSI